MRIAILLLFLCLAGAASVVAAGFEGAGRGLGRRRGDPCRRCGQRL